MKPTLQERLMSEARVKATYLGGTITDREYHFKEETLDQIILHTIEQTIKEGERVIEEIIRKEERTEAFIERNSTDSVYTNGRVSALTDTQHALRGIIK